jgi:DNA-binding IclR family transcriptional regulator
VTKERPRLRTKTTSVLNALAEAGPGGASAEDLGRRCGIRTRQAGARLRWLARGRLVRYVADGARWQLTDDSLFIGNKA